MSGYNPERRGQPPRWTERGANPDSAARLEAWRRENGDEYRQRMIAGTLGQSDIIKHIYGAWEGSPGWHPMLDAVNQVFTEKPLTSVPHVYRGRTGMVDFVPFPDMLAVALIEPLYGAHPIWVGPQQLDVLPPLGEDETVTAIRYGLQTRLPFQSVFLDFTDHAGRPAELDLGMSFGGRPSKHVLYGALCFHPGSSGADGTLVPSEGLMIVPFGCKAFHEDNHHVPYADLQGRRFMHEASPLGMLSIGARPGGIPEHDDVWAVGQAFPEGGMPTRIQDVMLCGQARFRIEDVPAWVACGTAWPCRDLLRWSQTIAPRSNYASRQELIERDDPNVKSDSIGVWPIAAHVSEDDESDVEVRASDGSVYYTAMVTDPREAEKAYSESWIVVRLAERALRALYLLEAHNVELVQTPHVSRQVRRAAQRKGTEIALAVSIRRSARPRRQPVVTGRTRNYSHSFERMGGYHHVTRGTHVTNPTDPEAVRLCPEWESRHPHSEVCRREYHGPALIDAGPGKPFVPKTRNLEQRKGK